jgi:hypothetical protein
LRRRATFRARGRSPSALAIREKVLGPKHRHTAISLNDLALLLQNQGDLAGARQLFERGAHYARLLLDTGRAAEALPLAQTALSTHDAALGSTHPWTKDGALVTADALAALGRADEAAALRARYGLSDDGK